MRLPELLRKVISVSPVLVPELVPPLLAVPFALSVTVAKFCWVVAVAMVTLV